METIEIMTPGEAAARERAAIARGKLQGIIDQGKAQASTIVERVLTDVPQDYIAKARSFTWKVTHKRAALQLEEREMDMHSHALGQAAERAGVPLRYLQDLIAGDDWQQQLAGQILNTHYGNDNARYLVRAAGGQVRGIMSDKFRRLDSRPLLEAFIGEASSLGLVPTGGIISDVRVSLKTVLPEVIATPRGRYGVIGLDWSNSDYGAGKYSIRKYMLELICINGLVGEDALSTVHLGKRIDEMIEVSDRTYKLDTATMVSFTKDVVKSAIGPASRERLLGRIEAADAAAVSSDVIRSGRLGNALTKTEQTRAKELFDGPEVVMLPPEKTKWRLSNALSWMANEADDPMRKLELERLAGEAIGERGAKEAA